MAVSSNPQMTIFYLHWEKLYLSEGENSGKNEGATVTINAHQIKTQLSSKEPMIARA